MAKVVVVPDDPLFRAYRDALVTLFNLAKEEIISLVGEIAAYRFVDVRWAAEAALDRGVKVKICAYNPSPDLQNRVLRSGTKLYLAKKGPDEKFMVIDRKHVFLRSKEKRAGEYHLDNPKMGKFYYNKFLKFMKEANAEPAPMVRWEKHPLLILAESH